MWHASIGDFSSTGFGAVTDPEFGGGDGWGNQVIFITQQQQLIAFAAHNFMVEESGIFKGINFYWFIGAIQLHQFVV